MPPVVLDAQVDRMVDGELKILFRQKRDRRCNRGVGAEAHNAEDSRENNGRTPAGRGKATTAVSTSRRTDGTNKTITPHVSCAKRSDGQSRRFSGARSQVGTAYLDNRQSEE